MTKKHNVPFASPKSTIKKLAPSTFEVDSAANGFRTSGVIKNVNSSIALGMGFDLTKWQKQKWATDVDNAQYRVVVTGTTSIRYHINRKANAGKQTEYLYYVIFEQTVTVTDKTASKSTSESGQIFFATGSTCVENP